MINFIFIIKTLSVLTCLCGKYEELEGANMFNLRKVTNNTCLLCGSHLYKQNIGVLLSDIQWPKNEDFSFNRTWCGTDLEHFLGRQTKTHKISKQDETIKFLFQLSEFGIRYQILWAALIVYLVNLNNDYTVTMHYVQKVQDKAFFVCSLAKMMCPNLHINFNAIPVVWIDDSPSILDCYPSHVKLLGKTLNTRRKELKVSLKSWRN